jgi:hypothetical protein
MGDSWQQQCQGHSLRRSRRPCQGRTLPSPAAAAGVSAGAPVGHFPRCRPAVYLHADLADTGESALSGLSGRRARADLDGTPAAHPDQLAGR